MRALEQTTPFAGARARRSCILVALLLAGVAGAVEFRVDSTADEPDISAGDGLCAAWMTEAGGRVRRCTLRAAVNEANARPGSDKIVLAFLRAPARA